jgi:two-component system NtrC family sensor kinase
LLNLINNAFYAVNSPLPPNGGTKKTPLVTVSTKYITPPLGSDSRRAGGAIEISVRDNGTGIPEEVQSKIFQPFFTTKPTGQGTGLGLSLAYDIVTKGHGGAIEVESVEGEGYDVYREIADLKQLKMT